MEATAVFDPVLLNRCRMSLKEIIQFREESRMVCQRDEETGAVVVAYIHPDGRVLLDAVRMPNL